MSAAAFISASLEQGINRLLALDPDSSSRLTPLQGKRLTVFLKHTPVAFTLAFSDRIDVLTESRTFDEVVAQLDSSGCCIQTELQSLPELRQTSRLTQLIQQNKLAMEGELAIAQQTSSLFQQLDIDWEEQFAGVTGDVVAHNVFAIANKARTTLMQFAGNAKAGVSNALTEEKDIAVPKIAVAHFADRVDQLRDDAERLDSRLYQLETKYAGK